MDHPTHRPLSDGYELVGLFGEYAWEVRFGDKVDMTPRPGGDGGKDYTIELWTGTEFRVFPVDIKTAQKPYNLLVEQGKCLLDTIYVLAGSDKKSGWLVGWEWGQSLIQVEPRTFGNHKVRNHYIHSTRLRKIEELEERRRK